MNMKVFLLILLLPTSAIANIIPIEPFKASSISFCKSEPTASLKKKCLVDAGSKMLAFSDILETKNGQSVLSLCSKSITEANNERLYFLLNCSVKQFKIRNEHPYPIWTDAILQMDLFRSEWVSRCFSLVGGGVNACVKAQNGGFSFFWKEYLELTRRDSKLFSEIKGCIGGDIFAVDFSTYQQCRNRQ
jgi:hypothetical protein